MGERPAISVVIPAITADDALRSQVRALAEQGFTASYEVIVAVNSPEESTFRDITEMVRAAGHAEFHVVDASHRPGPAAARNIGVSYATAPLLAFCDSDDVVAPGWLSALRDALEGSQFAGGRLTPFDPDGDPRRPPPDLTPGRLPTYMGVPYVMTANLAIHAALFHELGGFDERLRTCEDMALSWSASVAGHEPRWVPEANVHYRLRHGLRAVVRQYLHYGIGLSRIMLWYGVPEDGQWQPAGRRLLRGNPQPATGSRVPGTSVRRGATLLGRFIGLVQAGVAGRLGSAPPNCVDGTGGR